MCLGLEISKQDPLNKTVDIRSKSPLNNRLLYLSAGKTEKKAFQRLNAMSTIKI
jgi:hypothetical protein